MKQPQDYFLLTGATGLLGQYLTRDLMQAGHRVAVLVRGNKKFSPASRVEQFMQMWDRNCGELLQRPVCLAGNITEPQAGLDKADFEWVKNNCGNMIHCAASLTFTELNGEPWRTNVEGTKHVLQLCAEADIRHMHYISTAYVCGHREDLVKEDELDEGQEFRNDYENSKFQAETLVRDFGKFDALTVYRPVVITGDSETGYTSTYHGTYLYMKLARVLADNTDPNERGEKHIPIRWGLTGKERRNITPVDWNSEIICRLLSNPECHGQTFHLAPRETMTMRDAITFATKYYNITGIEFRGFGKNPDQPLNELERWIWSNISIYGSYDFMDPQFDTTNLQKYAGEPPSPPLNWALAKRLLDYAESDRWGKRKLAAPTEAVLCVREVLEAATGRSPTSQVSGDDLLGVEVLGPGGGPWQLAIEGDTITSFARGLPLSAAKAPVVKICIDELAAGLKAGQTALEIFRQVA